MTPEELAHKRGRRQSVTLFVNPWTAYSTVKPFKNSGAYIPMPTEWIGRKVKVTFEGEKDE